MSDTPGRPPEQDRPRMRDELQRTLGDSVTLERELGGGGMSRVFAATDNSLGRRIVVKVLEPDLAAEVNVERFRREIQLAARLQHAYIVPLLSAGVSDGLPYYTMPFVEGKALRAVLQEKGALPLPEAVKLLREICEALCYAHEHGIAHRDIKPENILVTTYHALVTDFGVAKALSNATDAGSGLTSVGVAIGTPAYMAPEQALGDPATDHRADIYSLGAIAYEMLTGQRVFSDRTKQAMLAAHAVEKPESITVRRANTPPALSAIVMRCLEKHPADRPQNAREILNVLDTLVTSGAMSAVSAAATEVPAASPNDSRVRRRWLVPAVIAAAALMIAAGWYLLNPREAAARNTKVVVLPFENLGNASDEYFADGVSEEVTNRLVKLTGLSVVARSSAAQMRKAGKDARTIGRELDADYVLDGTVRWARSGGNSMVRVNPQLVNVSSGTQVWGDQYEAVLSEVFTVQTQIAENVARALGTRLARQERQALREASTANVEAYNAYMLGRFHWKKRGPESLQRAAQLFQQAIQLDPEFARAYAGLADCYSLFGFYNVPALSEAEAYRRAKQAARRAIELDPQLAEGYAALGEVVYYADWDYPQARDLFRKAIALDPAYATAHQWYGEMSWSVGEFTRSVSELRLAEQLEPFSPVITTSLGFAFRARGELDSAEAAYKRALQVDPDFQLANLMLGGLYISKGRYDEALARWVAADVPREAALLVVNGLRTPAHRQTTLAEIHKTPLWDPQLYVLLDERDSAIAVISRQVRARAFIGTVLRADPVLRRLRGDPRYERLLEEAGSSDRQLRAAGFKPES